MPRRPDFTEIITTTPKPGRYGSEALGRCYGCRDHLGRSLGFAARFGAELIYHVERTIGVTAMDITSGFGIFRKCRDSDLSPKCAPERKAADRSEFMRSPPGA